MKPHISHADHADLRRQNPKTAKQQQLQQPQTTCLSLRDNTACCIPLRNLRYLRENIHARVLNLSAQMNPHISHADDRRQATKPNKLQPVFLCEIMQLSCIHLRPLRYLRENIHARVLNLSAQMKPQCLPQISQIYADKTPKLQQLQQLQQPVFLCGIMQLAAFLCVICDICGRITRKSTQSISTNETPMSLADLADLRRQNPKTAKQQQQQQPQTTCLSLRYNAAQLHSSASSALSAREYPRKSTQSISTNENPVSYADHADNRRQATKPNKLQTVFLCEIMQLGCIRLRNLRNLRENIHARVLNLLAQMKPNISHTDHADKPP